MATVKENERGEVRYGGVSAHRHRSALHGHGVEPGYVMPPGTAYPTFMKVTDFTYHGGPVIWCPRIYASYWGGDWRSNLGLVSMAGQLNQYLKDLLVSKFMNVLTQYIEGMMPNTGAFMQPSYVDLGTVGTTTLTDAQVQTIIQSKIDAGVFPDPSTVPSSPQHPAGELCLIIFLGNATYVDLGGSNTCGMGSPVAFGYHNFFTTRTGSKCYYAIIANCTDDCINTVCSGISNCALSTSIDPLDRKTQVASHEFAEMVTDPQLTGWYSPSPTVGECGDYCNGAGATIAVEQRTWTVQKIYSKRHDLAGNSDVCIAEADAPLQLLPEAPRALPELHAVRRAVQARSFDRLLPLPELDFDLETQSVAIDDAALQDYVKRVFKPMRHEHLVPQLSTFLRQLADALDKAEG